MVLAASWSPLFIDVIIDLSYIYLSYSYGSVRVVRYGNLPWSRANLFRLVLICSAYYQFSSSYTLFGINMPDFPQFVMPRALTEQKLEDPTTIKEITLFSKLYSIVCRFVPNFDCASVPFRYALTKTPTEKPFCLGREKNFAIFSLKKA